MRALTVRQPWAWQIINQGKNIENRTRNIAGKYRGPVAIHAALKPDEEALRRLPMRAPEWVTVPRVFDYGVILGVVDLVDVHQSAPFCCGSDWGELIWGGYHLVLANPRPISTNPVANPGIPCRGALGLWTPPADIIEQITAAVSQTPKVLGDHPHTDPGDGRTECDTCGKWVFECIHSCKGVPVTDAAWERFRARHPEWSQP